MHMAASRMRNLLTIGLLLAPSLVMPPGKLGGGIERSLEGSHDADLLAAIKRPGISKGELSQAISQLGPVAEKADFWVSITNDPRFSDLHRAYCVMQLFKRHVKPGMTLADLGDLLKGAKWLHGHDHIEHFIVLGGFVPVEWPLNASLFSIGLSRQDPDLVLFLSIYGEFDSLDLANSLRGDQANPNLVNQKIADCWPR
jgi:hypothetical protein